MPRPGRPGGPGRWQSVLCLEDTPADRGGWWCVPDYHKLWADPQFHFRRHCQQHVTERGTDGDEFMIVYDRTANGWGGPPGQWGARDRIFSMRFRLALTA